MRLTREEYLAIIDERAQPKSPAEWDRIGQSIANEIVREKQAAAKLKQVVSVQPTDITVRSRTESEQNAGETGYKHE